jgi:hypothetical protein
MRIIRGTANDWRSVVGVVCHAVVVVVVVCAGCGGEPPADPLAGQMVYVDRETGRPTVANIAREVPALHPDTGKRSLDPALYCSKCQEWRVVPSLEVMQRDSRAMTCRQCGTKLTKDGPWPTEAGGP